MPHKIRHFTWRACRDILPFKTNLVKRNVLQVDTCEGCNVGAEDSIHFFWKCSCAKEVWSASKLVFPAVLDQLCSFKDLLWCLMMDAKISPKNIEPLVTCAWAMWGNKNSVCYSGTRKEGSELLQWAVHYLDEYQTVVDSLPAATEPVQHVTRWNPPYAPCFKFNVDGAIFPELHSVGVGVLAHD